MIEADDLRKGFGDRLLIEDLSFTLPPAGIVGVIGAQRRRQDDAVPDDRRRRRSPTPARCASARPSSSPTSTSRATRSTPTRRVWEEISEGYEQIKVGDREIELARLRGRLQLQGLRPAAKVGELSGGERNRVHLAKLLRRGGNLLLLDEPTNDLDVDTAARARGGAAGLPGLRGDHLHDRWFLDRVATHVLAFEGDSQVAWFEGNFEAYEEHRRAALGAEADRPHRITYKKLTRA